MEAYRTVYRLIYYAGQKPAAVMGVVVIVILTVLGGDLASNAIPYGTLWVLFCGGMRLLIVVLPRPSSGGSIVPTEKPLPKAALAVSITPDCPPEAAPGRDAINARLPAELRGLLR